MWVGLLQIAARLMSRMGRRRMGIMAARGMSLMVEAFSENRGEDGIRGEDEVRGDRAVVRGDGVVVRGDRVVIGTS